jgi:hypothetical protein
MGSFLQAIFKVLEESVWGAVSFVEFVDGIVLIIQIFRRHEAETPPINRMIVFLFR